MHGGQQFKVSKIQDRSQYIVSQNTWWSTMQNISKKHGGLQFKETQNTWWFTLHSISKYIVVYNAKYIKIHDRLQYMVSQNTWWFKCKVSQNT